MIEWNIQARAHGCQSCKKLFSDHEQFHTFLFDQKHGYERLDVCSSCWSEQFSQGATDRKGFISHWQSLYATPPSAPPDAIQKETAETLLRKLLEQNDPAHRAARFILAVMLERKRILKIKTQLMNGGERVFIYEHAKSGDLFHIPDPNLRLNELEEVQRDIGHLLEHGSPSPAATVPTESVTVHSPGSEEPKSELTGVEP